MATEEKPISDATKANKTKDAFKVKTTSNTDATGGYVSQDEQARRIAEGEKRVDPNPEVPSNHNSTSPAQPLGLAVLQGKPDYNPMRAVGNKANDKTDVTLVPDTAKELVAEKGERPDAAEVEYYGGTDMKGGELKGRAPAERSTDTVAVEGDA